MEGLGINLPTLLAQILNFLILLVLLYAFAYKPFMHTLDQRAHRIKESLQEADNVRAQAAKAEEEFKKKAEQSAKEGQEIVARAMRTGEEARQRALQEAKQEAQSLVEKARVEIQRERDEAVGELRQQFADLTIDAAEKVIERSLDKQSHQGLIDKVLEESTTLKGK